MKEMKSVRVESSLLNKELTVLWETDMGLTELSVLLARSRSDGWFFVILRDECSRFLEVMEMTDKSTKEHKVFIFRSQIEHAFGTIEVEVTIDVEHRRWSVEIR